MCVRAAVLRSRLTFFEALRRKTAGAATPCAADAAGDLADTSSASSGDLDPSAGSFWVASAAQVPEAAADKLPEGSAAAVTADSEPPRPPASEASSRTSEGSSGVLVSAMEGAGAPAGAAVVVKAGPHAGPAAASEVHASCTVTDQRASAQCQTPPVCGLAPQPQHEAQLLPAQPRRHRSAELWIPAEEEAFLRSLGWEECDDDEAEGAGLNVASGCACLSFVR